MVKESSKKTSVLSALFGAVALVPNWTAALTLSLLGLAGGTAVTVAGWLSPILVGVSAALLARAHYVLYRLKRGNVAAAAVTWIATVLVVAFWTWQWVG